MSIKKYIIALYFVAFFLFGSISLVGASCSLQSLKECDRAGLISVIMDLIKSKQLNNRADLTKFKATEIVSNNLPNSIEFWTQAYCPASGTKYDYNFNYYRYNLGDCEEGEIGSHGGCPTCVMSKIKLVGASTCNNDSFNYYQFGKSKILIETSYFNESEKYKEDCKICQVGIFGKGMSQVIGDSYCENVSFENDYNFDGYNDLAIKTIEARNDSYDIYLYDKKSNGFVKNLELSNLANVFIDLKNKRIVSGYNGRDDRNKEEYEYIDSKLKLVRSCWMKYGAYICYVYDSQGLKSLDKYNIDENKVLLRKASQEGDVELVDELIRINTPINDMGDERAESALILASRSGKVEIVKKLVSSMADINLKGFGGVTSVMEAVKGNQVEVLNVLIALGADINLKDSNGKTALVYAKEKNNFEFMEILKNAGAK